MARKRITVYTTGGTFSRQTKMIDNALFTENEIKTFLKAPHFSVYDSTGKRITRENLHSLFYAEIPATYVSVIKLPQTFVANSTYAKKTVTVESTTKTYYESLSTEPADYKTAYATKYFVTPTAAAVTGESAPTFELYTYYSKQGTTGSEYYVLLTEAPSDWATTYTTYYTISSATALTGVTAPTWTSGRYFTRTGSEGSYVYTVQTTQPSDWSTNCTSYFEEE